jgi:uncharacterized protein YjdB/pimeloyl-ACP methyl ester carboxylesterase
MKIKRSWRVVLSLLVGVALACSVFTPVGAADAPEAAKADPTFVIASTGSMGDEIDDAKKAIYVLPGYMGSQLYDQAGQLAWLEPNYLLQDIVLSFTPYGSQFTLNPDGSGSKMHADASQDQYGTLGAYAELVARLKAEFSSEYDVHFFPYNWLGDLNDAATELQGHIDSLGYRDVVFVTHSTGGLLASAYIAKGRENKLKVEKAILLAAPLNGTYMALEPIETGMTQDIENMIATAFQSGLPLGVNPSAIYNWIKGVTHNSPTTYQLLPSPEYLSTTPLIFKSGDGSIAPMASGYDTLNRSVNINPALTNGEGNNRSHQYLRETVFGGSVASVLQEVDTVLVGSSYYQGQKTPKSVMYADKNDAYMLSDIIYTNTGDGTVAADSAFGFTEKSGGILPCKDFKGLSHRELASDDAVLDYVCSYIKGEPADGTAVAGEGDGPGMSQLLKFNLEFSTGTSIVVTDTSGTAVAGVTTGGSVLGGLDYTVLSGSLAPTTSAIMYLPNGGCKVNFLYGNATGAAVNFSCKVSTLDHDGYRTATAEYQADTTLPFVPDPSYSGLIMSMDISTPKNTSDIGSLATAVGVQPVQPTIFHNDWDLLHGIKLELHEPKDIQDALDKGVVKDILTGPDREAVIDDLKWTSSNDAVAYVPERSTYVVANGYGETVISASDSDGNKAVAVTVTVALKADKVEMGDVSMVTGERALIKPAFTPAGATETDMTYSSSDDSVVSVDEYGVMKAGKSGSAKITGQTDYGVEGTFNVTVKDRYSTAVQSIAISPSKISVVKGAKATATVSFTPSNATNKMLEWHVEDEGIATIAAISKAGSCDIQGLNEGATRLIAVSLDGGYLAYADVEVTKPSQVDDSTEVPIEDPPVPTIPVIPMFPAIPEVPVIPETPVTPAIPATEAQAPSAPAPAQAAALAVILHASNVSVADEVWTGKSIKKGFILRANGKRLAERADYAVVGTKNAKNIGKAFVTVRGKGSYEGEVTLAFRIIPKKVSLKKVLAGSKSAKATWIKADNAQKIDGYQVRYRIAGKKWSSKTAAANATNLTVKKLKKVKKYMVSVRAYKNVKGVKYYGPWSAVKTSRKVK